MISVPVLENVAHATEIAGVSIGEYASLHASQIPYNLLAATQYPATFQLAPLALTDVTYLKSVFLCSSETISESCAVVLLETTTFKNDEEERGELRELVKCLHSTIFYTGKSKEKYKELFFTCWYQIGTPYRQIREFGCLNRIRKKKNCIETYLSLSIIKYFVFSIQSS